MLAETLLGELGELAACDEVSGRRGAWRLGLHGPQHTVRLGEQGIDRRRIRFGTWGPEEPVRWRRRNGWNREADDLSQPVEQVGRDLRQEHRNRIDLVDLHLAVADGQVDRNAAARHALEQGPADDAESEQPADPARSREAEVHLQLARTRVDPQGPFARP